MAHDCTKIQMMIELAQVWPSNLLKLFTRVIELILVLFCKHLEKRKKGAVQKGFEVLALKYRSVYVQTNSLAHTYVRVERQKKTR